MKKKSVIILVLPFILVVLLISVSFAFFRSVTKVDKELVIGSLEIDYVEGSEINTSLKPIKEDEVLDKAYKLEFSISNINDVDIMSKIKLHINNISDNIKNDLKYKLYENDFELVNGSFTNSNAGDDLLLRDELYYEPGKTKNYVLYIYIEDNDNNQNYIRNNNIDLKVEVDGKKITTSNLVNIVANGFWLTEYKDNIKQIDFVDYINLDNAVNLSNGTGDNYWDMSVDGDKSIIAWLESNEDNTYHLYIGTNKDYIFATSCDHYFRGFRMLESINFNKVFRIDNVTSLTTMFQFCNNLKELDLKYFDTSNVTNMEGMFYQCFSLENLNISSFNTESVTSMNQMFYDCELLKEIDVSKFNTSNVTDMSIMFSHCYSLTRLDLSNFDTSNVTDINHMFSHCYDLEKVDLSSFDTSNVSNMNGLFHTCTTLKYLDLSTFDTSNVVKMYQMFFSCNTLEKLNLSSFNTSKVEDMSDMFNWCNSLLILDLSNFDTSNVTNKDGMFNATKSVEKAYAKDEETANFFNSDTAKPSTYEFVVKK